MAFGDTVIPAVQIPDTPQSSSAWTLEPSQLSSLTKSIEAAESDGALVQSYLAESASSVPGLKDYVNTIMSEFVPEDGRKGLCSILSALK